jgi:hypothetical protein
MLLGKAAENVERIVTEWCVYCLLLNDDTIAVWSVNMKGRDSLEDV